MRTTTRVAVAALLAWASTGARAPAGAQEMPPAPVTTAEVWFDGLCAGGGQPYIPPLPLPPPVPGRGRATLVVPDAVEAGAPFTVDVTSILGLTQPPGTYARIEATFAVVGGSPATVRSSASVGSGPLSPLALTATGAPGTVVTIRLNSAAWNERLGGPFNPTPIYRGEGCTANGGPEQTVGIPIVAPVCLGRDATVVGLPDEAVVEGTAGDDVIVARAAGAVVRPGGGDDRVCALGGGATLDLGGARHGQFVALEAGRAFGGGGDTVQFSGVTRVQGSSRRDALVGSAGDDELLGGAGDDVVIGLAGADLLDGQAGHDLLVGDAADTCVSSIALGCG